MFGTIFRSLLLLIMCVALFQRTESQNLGSTYPRTYNDQALIELAERNFVFESFDPAKQISSFRGRVLRLDSDSQGTLLLNPFITVQERTGQLGFHLWVSYVPIYSPLGGVFRVRPESLKISSAYRTVNVPLIFYEQNPSTTAVAIPGRLSEATEVSYASLHPEDLMAILAVVFEKSGRETQFEGPFAPLAQRRDRYSRAGTDANKYINEENNRIANLDVEFSRDSNPQSFGASSSAESQIQEPHYTERVWMTLHGETDLSWTTSYQEMDSLLEVIDLHFAMADRRVISSAN